MGTETALQTVVSFRPICGDLTGYVGLPTVQQIVGIAGKGIADSSDPLVLERIHSAAMSYVGDLESLRRFAINGSHKAARAKVNHILNSFHARASAALLGLKKGSVIGTWSDLSALAFQMDCRRPSGEPVKAWAKDKSSGEWRPICEFGPIGRSCQRLVLDLLRAWMGDSPFEYARKGRGRDRAINAILGSIRNGGARWFITADIRDFYRNIRPEGLRGIIPLPASVTRNVISVPLENPILSGSDNPITLQTAAREGIPQGSLASPFIAAKVVEAVLQSLHCRITVSYVDNLCLGFKTECEAKTILHALVQALTEHPAGPLLLKGDVAIFELGKPNDFLGYRISRRWPSDGGYAYAHPSPAAFEKMTLKLRATLEDVEDDDALLQVATAYVAAWLAAQVAWERNTYSNSLVMDIADREAADEHSRRHPYFPQSPKSVEELLAKLKKAH